jgi:hypothetical protein
LDRGVDQWIIDGACFWRRWGGGLCVSIARV